MQAHPPIYYGRGYYATDPHQRWMTHRRAEQYRKFFPLWGMFGRRVVYMIPLSADLL